MSDPLTFRYCPECKSEVTFVHSDPDGETAFDCPGCNRRFFKDRTEATVRWEK